MQFQKLITFKQWMVRLFQLSKRKMNIRRQTISWTSIREILKLLSILGKLNRSRWTVWMTPDMYGESSELCNMRGIHRRPKKKLYHFMIAQMKTTRSSIQSDRKKKRHLMPCEKTRNKILFALIGMTQTHYNFMALLEQQHHGNCLSSWFYHVMQSMQI